MEETDLELYNIDLFGIYSGHNGLKEYPNGDKIYSIQIIFICKEYTGVPKQEGAESFEHRFFHKSELPHPLNAHQAQFILDWAEGMHNKLIIK